MKKTLYILCMVMFCLADATAQQASHRLQMPMPGIDMSQTHGKRHADTKKQPAEKPQALYARGCNVRIVKPQQTTSPLKAEAMTKKTLLTGMETIYKDAEEPTQSYRNNGTVTYTTSTDTSKPSTTARIRSSTTMCMAWATTGPRRP